MFADSAAYETFMGRWSRRLAPLVVEFAGVGGAVVDVGCGTGALSAAVVAASPSAEVVGVDPSPAFVDLARTFVPSARFEVGDAQALPLADDSVDVAVSSLVLNFVPDHRQALREMQRVTRPGGVVASAVWDYSGGMQMLCRFWDVATATFADVDVPDENRMPLCHPGELAALWRDAGLHDITDEALVIECLFSSFDDYWLPFLGGVGPSGQFVSTLQGDDRALLRAALQHELSPDGGAFVLPARAWAVRGVA